MGTVVRANEEMNEIMKHAQVRIKTILRSLARMNNALEPKQYYVQRVHHSVCVSTRVRERQEEKEEALYVRSETTTRIVSSYSCVQRRLCSD